MIEVVLNCPYGHDCEKVVMGKIHRCRLYQKVEQKNVKTGEDISRFECALVLTMEATIEHLRISQGVNDAVISLREETTKRQDAILSRPVIHPTPRLING